MKNLALSMSFAFLTACTSTTSLTPHTFDKVGMDALLSDAVSSGDVIGVSALVFDEGNTVYTGTFGLGDRERATPLTKDSVFRIYSMTKPITSTVIMALVEEGKISLDDPVSKYIPEIGQMKVAAMGEGGTVSYTAPKKPITIKHLLLHKSGMAYGIFGDINPVENAYGNADLLSPNETLAAKMKKLAELPLLAEPDTSWYYSISIDVLGRIIEIVEDKPLGDVFQDRIFTPLKMNETGFAVRDDQKSRFVSNYALVEDGSFTLAEDGQTSPFLNDNAFQSGGGGLVSTLGDYAKYAEMMLNKGTYNGQRIVKTSTVETMMANHMSPSDTYLFPWIGGDSGAGFGYGGSVQVTATAQQAREKGRHSGQWGWSGAARTTFYIDPQNDAFAIILLQFFSKEDPKIHHDFQALTLSQTDDLIED